MNVAVYLRVSTDRQDEQNQEPACLQVCEARTWTPIVYREVKSGVKWRPEWDRLLSDARLGKFKGVVFYSIFRVGRKRVQIAQDLAELARWGMALVSVRERFLDVDSSPELARVRGLLIEWWGWFAEAERDEIVDRTNRALAKIKTNLATRGQHTSTKTGRTIESLGRPRKFETKWHARARSLAAAGGVHVLGEATGGRWVALATPGAIAAQLEREGCHGVSRSTVRDWIITKAKTESSTP